MLELGLFLRVSSRDCNTLKSMEYAMFQSISFQMKFEAPYFNTQDAYIFWIFVKHEFVGKSWDLITASLTGYPELKNLSPLIVIILGWRKYIYYSPFSQVFLSLPNKYPASQEHAYHLFLLLQV